MAGCLKCREERKKEDYNVSAFGPTQYGMSGTVQKQLKDSGGLAVAQDELTNMSVDDRKRFEASLYDKTNVSLLRHMPKGILGDIQTRADGGSKTAENLLHILWNPMNREKVIPGCLHQHDELTQLIDELVALYCPKGGG